MNIDISQFHFIRPWLLLVLPALVLVWYMSKHMLKNNRWENVISKDMLAALQLDHSTTSSRWQWLLLLGWVLAVLAVAGPTWHKTPLPTVQNQKALVIALDLSPSMLAQDLAPDRLSRAKLKLIDILRSQKDGQVALIVYAGEAHTVSPLTDDPRTIEALLPALHPSIVPSQGSNAEQAIQLAQQLLIDAQAANGDILLITDGVTTSAQTAIAPLLAPAIDTAGRVRNKLSILGVGGVEPAPIPQAQGGFLRDNDGGIVLAGVNNDELQTLARTHEGSFASLANDDSDINLLLNEEFQSGDNSQQGESQNVFYDSWQDMGHWLVLLLIPFVALCFRKGLIYLLPLTFMLPLDSSAQSLDDFSWDDLWRTRDQQAQALLEQKKYADAARTFKRQDHAGSANFKAQNFDDAQKQFANSPGIKNLYNKGLAQAFNGDLTGALKTFDQVLEQQSDYTDALHNKKVIEDLLNNQQQEQQHNQNDSGQDNEENDSEQQNSDNQSSDNQNTQEQESNDEHSNDQSSQNQDQKNSDQPQQDEPSQQQDTDKNNTEQQESEQQESETENQSQEEQRAQKPEPDSTEQQQTGVAQASEEPLKDSSERWLRAISDDPSRLLRNKFQYQSQQRAGEQRRARNTPQEDNQEIRY